MNCPLLITQRDRREKMVTMPIIWIQQFQNNICSLETFNYPLILIDFKNYDELKPYNQWACFKLDSFINWLTPDKLKEYYNGLHPKSITTEESKQIK